MEGRKRSFAAGMQHQTQGLARTASQVFFKQESHDTPVSRRPIFYFYVFFLLAFLGGALAIVIAFFKTSPGTGAFSQGYVFEAAPPIDWGKRPDGSPCPFGGCSKAPTLFSPTTLPTTSPQPSG